MDASRLRGQGRAPRAARADRGRYARGSVARPIGAPVSHIPRFAAYAAAFEKAFASDDWSLVEPFFTESAVYEVGLGPPLGGRFEGRAEILRYFKRALDGFDRRFASRKVALVAGPREDGDAVWFRGSATYAAPGVPELSFELEETVHFEGDRISRLEDRYEPEVARALDDYAAAHGAKLGLGTQTAR